MLLMVTCLMSYSEHHQFVLLCLKLLCTHLSLAVAGGVASTVLGNQARPLRHLLFRLMDMRTPDTVQVVCPSDVYSRMVFTGKIFPVKYLILTFISGVFTEGHVNWVVLTYFHVCISKVFVFKLYMYIVYPLSLKKNT